MTKVKIGVLSAITGVLGAVASTVSYQITIKEQRNMNKEALLHYAEAIEKAKKEIISLVRKNRQQKDVGADRSVEKQLFDFSLELSRHMFLAKHYRTLSDESCEKRMLSDIGERIKHQASSLKILREGLEMIERGEMPAIKPLPFLSKDSLLLS